MFDKRSDELLSAANTTTYLTQEGLEALHLFQNSLQDSAAALDPQDPDTTAYFQEHFRQLDALLQLIIDRLQLCITTISSAAETFQKGVDQNA